MYIRKVTMWVKRDAVHAFTSIYTQGVIPALRETDGCLFAALLQNVRRHEMCSSLTIWRSREKAAEYEKSGLYERLLASLRHLFHDASDWQDDLLEDLKLDFAPTPERPVVVGFEEASAQDRHTPALPRWVHLLPLHARSDKVGEFRQQFTRNVLSVVSPQRGFIDAFLMHRLEQHHSFFVLSFWDSTVEPGGIMTTDTVHQIRSQASGVLSGDTAETGRIESLVFRRLTGEWFGAPLRAAAEK